MIIIRFLSILFLIFVLISCEDKKDVYSDIKFIEWVDESSNQNEYLADSIFTSDTKLVRLQLTDESIINRIRAIASDSSNIFILDRTQSSIFNFDSEGNFKNKLEAIGRGPGEYNAVIDLSINPEEKYIYLLCDRPYKLMTFDYDFNFIEEIVLNDLYFDFLKTDDSFIIRKLLDLNASNPNSIEIVNSNSGSLEKRLLKFDKNTHEKLINLNGGIVGSMLTKSSSILTTTDIDNTIIYEVLEDTIVPKYKFNKQDDSHINEPIISNMIETENYLFFKMGDGISLLDKSSEELKRYKGVMNYEEYNASVHEHFKVKGQKSMISFVIYPSSVKSIEGIFEERIKTMKDTSDINRIFLDFAKKTKLNDNPILLLYEVK